MISLIQPIKLTAWLTPERVLLAEEHACKRAKRFTQQTGCEVELVRVFDELDWSDARTEPRRLMCVRDLRAATGATLGDKRNQAVSMARGTYIFHWDGDDWYGPDRLLDQYLTLIEARLHDSPVVVTGYSQGLFYDVRDQSLWRYSDSQNYFIGASLAYRHSVAVDSPFPRLNVGEDNGFIQAAKSAFGRTACMATGHLHHAIYRTHGSNTSPRDYSNRLVWWPVSYEMLPVPGMLPEEFRKENGL